MCDWPLGTKAGYQLRWALVLKSEHPSRGTCEIYPISSDGSDQIDSLDFDFVRVQVQVIEYATCDFVHVQVQFIEYATFDFT